MCICKVYVLEKQHGKEIQVHGAIRKVHGILQGFISNAYISNSLQNGQNRKGAYMKDSE
jgi:hypothetical protein